jgi:hypothetical protein
MLSEKRTKLLRDSLNQRKMEIFSEGYAKNWTRWDIEKINAEEIKKLNDQIEILEVVLGHNNV